MHEFLKILAATVSPVTIILGIWMIPNLWTTHMTSVRLRFEALKEKRSSALSALVPRKCLEHYIIICGVILVPSLLCMVVRYIFHDMALVIFGWIMIIALLSFRGYTKWRMAFYARQDDAYWDRMAKIRWGNGKPNGAKGKGKGGGAKQQGNPGGPKRKPAPAVPKTPE